MQWFRWVLPALVVALAAAPVAAQPRPTGDELQLDNAGSTRVFHPAGIFTRDGRIRVVWDSAADGIVTRVFDLAGTPSGRDVPLAGNDLPTEVPYRGPALVRERPAMVPVGGGFAAFWVEEEQELTIDVFYYRSDVISRRVVGQRFDADGKPVSAPFPVSGGELGRESHPRALRLANGRLLVAWETSDAGTAEGLYARVLRPGGSALGPAFRLDAGFAEGGRQLALAAGPEGSFFAVWRACCDGSGDRGVFGRMFDASGDPLGPAFTVPSRTAGEQSLPAVARASAGHYLVAWTGPGDLPGLEWRIYGQQVATDGTIVGPEIAISDGGGRAHGAPAVAAGPGGYLVAWTQWSQHFPSALRATFLDTTARQVGGIEDVSTGRLNIQWRIELVPGPSGRYLAAWEGFDSDGTTAIRGRLLEAPGSAGRATGTAALDH